MNKLFKPFEYIAGTQALLIGLLVMALSILLGIEFGVRFDGVLDMHIAPQQFWYYYLLEQIVNIGSLCLVFVIAKLLLKSHARLIDILGTLSMARVPILLGGLVSLAMPIEQLMEIAKDPLTMDIDALVNFFMKNIMVILPVSIILILLIVYYIQLLWQSFKTCFNSTDSRAILLFVSALIVAEIISKISLSFINSALPSYS